MNKKLWEKPNLQSPQWLIEFTSGKDRTMDLQLAQFDVIGSIAHTEMLKHVGLISKDDASKLLHELRNIEQHIQQGNFEIQEGVEDIHSQIELLLTEKLGEIGKKIHTARSRNDQVLLDIKLYIKHQLTATTHLIEQLFHTLILKSKEHKNVLLPGYTHLQAAMPSSFGLWFGAYAESLCDDLELILAAYQVADKNPLGSGAGYGSSLPINRQYTTQLLGFEDLNYNVVYAQMTRGKTEKIAAMALANLSSTLSKLAMDVCLYNSQNFGFISFPDELTTGSSIMPHKKNPDVFELIRAKCNRIQALPNELSMLLINLPSGYHRDLQLSKEIIFPAFGEIQQCLNATLHMLQHIQIHDKINEEKYNLIFSVEAVNEMVMQGVPFREAYQIIGQETQSETFHYSKEVQHTHEGSIGNLCLDQITERFHKLKRRMMNP